MKDFLNEQSFENVTGACHNACVWLIKQCHANGLLPYDVMWVTGRYGGFDHSWLEVENVETGEMTVFDPTVSQFKDDDLTYVGPRTASYQPHQSVNAAFIPEVIELAEAVGS